MVKGLLQVHGSFKASETLLGIETQWAYALDATKLGFKASETLLGIETRTYKPILSISFSFKASETLLGIETAVPLRLKFRQAASKPLKPF